MTSYGRIFHFCHMNDIGRPAPEPHVHIYTRDSAHRKLLFLSPDAYGALFKRVIGLAMARGRQAYISFHPAGTSVGFFPKEEGPIDLFGMQA